MTNKKAPHLLMKRRETYVPAVPLYVLDILVQPAQVWLTSSCRVFLPTIASEDYLPGALHSMLSAPACTIPARYCRLAMSYSPDHRFFIGSSI